jgi:hypothetical protein
MQYQCVTTSKVTVASRYTNSNETLILFNNNKFSHYSFEHKEFGDYKKTDSVIILKSFSSKDKLVNIDVKEKISNSNQLEFVVMDYHGKNIQHPHTGSLIFVFNDSIKKEIVIENKIKRFILPSDITISSFYIIFSSTNYRTEKYFIESYKSRAFEIMVGFSYVEYTYQVNMDKESRLFNRFSEVVYEVKDSILSPIIFKDTVILMKELKQGKITDKSLSKGYKNTYLSW